MKYQVNFTNGGWTNVDGGIVLVDGRLAWQLGNNRGIAPAPYWMLQDKTRESAAFRLAGWNALTPEERQYSLERRGLIKLSVAA